MQAEIDRGLKHCGKCDEFGVERFCGHCGARYVGPDLDWRTCPKCSTEVSTDYCSVCGYNVYDETVRRWEDGDVDWEAESEMAAAIMQRFYEVRPDLAPEHFHAQHVAAPSTLGEAVLATFGRRT